jgi:hypothetical protein
MFTVPVTHVEATEEFGLSVDFDLDVTKDQLNHDDFPFPFEYTKVFGRLQLVSPQGGPSFDTPTIKQNF